MANINQSKEKTPMPELAPDVRNKNWEEVAIGYSEADAVNEANRCLNCKHKPCIDGCPVYVQIPEFIELMKKGDFANAFLKIKETNSLPAICGRVCPQETQCEAKCVRAIKGESVAIGRLERFCADWAGKNNTSKPPHGIIVFGLNGSGKTTLGRELARILNYKFMDHEDYAFEEKYTKERPREEYEKMMRDDIEKYGSFVISACRGDFNGINYDLAVYLKAPLDIRLERVKQRKSTQGFSYEQNQVFFDFVANRSEEPIEKWAETLTCPVIHIDGTTDWRENAANIAARFNHNHKIAVVGSGPAGLTCAGDLAQMGYDVTIFEALHEPGGVLVYGIPEFRLPKEIVKKEIDALRALGVKIVTNMVIGRILSVDDLFEQDYKAVFIGSGAGLPGFLNIPGENSNGVYSANEFLTRVNLMKAYDTAHVTPIKPSRKTAVVGGGNVAMDAARCAKRLGTDEVYIIYRRSEIEMPARIEEVHHAKEEGIIFKVLTNPVSVNADEKGNVTSITCVEMELGEPDESGRRRPKEKKDSEFDIEIDTVVIAVGTSPNPLIRMTTPGLEVNKWGCIVVGEDEVSTSREGVFAGGDTVSGAATVILAMGAGKSAAVAIDKYVKGKYEK